jgi:phenylpyruvate tautomerase PptA (4-oxalocrotonate tautomerase family)
LYTWPISPEQELLLCDALVNLGSVETEQGLHTEGVRIIQEVLHCTQARKKMKGWVYEVAEDADYNGGSPSHQDLFYFIEVRLPAGRFDVLTKRHMMLDFTKIILRAEGKPLVPEEANRVWVTIAELKEDDWGIGDHTDWLHDYESALDTLGLELKPRT